jgi:hypothetical protein
MNILNLNPVVNRSFLAYSYDPKTPFATLDLYLYVNLLKGGLHVFYGHMAAVQLLGTVMTIPRRGVLPCTQKTAHSTPSNCWISVETFESLNKSLWGRGVLVCRYSPVIIPAIAFSLDSHITVGYCTKLII